VNVSEKKKKREILAVNVSARGKESLFVKEKGGGNPIENPCEAMKKISPEIALAKTSDHPVNPQNAPLQASRPQQSLSPRSESPLKLTALMRCHHNALMRILVMPGRLLRA
jgi:hypothetical protein